MPGGASGGLAFLVAWRMLAWAGSDRTGATARTWESAALPGVTGKMGRLSAWQRWACARNECQSVSRIWREKMRKPSAPALGWCGGPQAWDSRCLSVC